MTAWLAGLAEARTGQPLAMITVLATEGSAPRGSGTRMLVTATGSSGTIGGGQLEFRAVEQARALLGHPPGSWRVQDYPLGPLLGQCCGGRVRLLVEHVDPAALGWLAEAAEGGRLVSTLAASSVERRVCDDAVPASVGARGERPGVGAQFVETIGEARRVVYLFGAGHVGQAIARHAAALPLRLAWFDTRADYADAGAVVVDAESIERCVEEAPAEAAMLILTHDHAIDYRLTRAALARSPLAFVGLIGSATKRARFLHRLEGDGIDAAARARLTCPIGVPGILGKEPDVIAIAALAQLLQLETP